MLIISRWETDLMCQSLSFRIPAKKKSSASNLVIFFTVLLVASACATVSTSVAPNINLGAIKTFYIVQNADDSRGVYQSIQHQMSNLGRQVSSGAEFSRPKDVDAVVTYNTRWNWDLWWYLSDLVIEVRDPKTNVLLASGLYAQRFSRGGVETVVTETVNSIFKGISR